MVSEAIDEDPGMTPTQAMALQALLRRFRNALEGRSVRLEPGGAVDLFDGDSGDFLVPWW
jgi:hypothetical protein